MKSQNKSLQYLWQLSQFLLNVNLKIKEEKMKTNKLFLLVLFTALFLFTAANQSSFAQKKYPIDITKEIGLPKGTKLEILAEYDSPVPGYGKVQYVRLTLDPGAKIENFTTPSADFCKVESGKIHVIMPDGMEMDMEAPSSWVEAKGTTYKVIENRGDKPCLDYMFMLMEK